MILPQHEETVQIIINVIAQEARRENFPHTESTPLCAPCHEKINSGSFNAPWTQCTSNIKGRTHCLHSSPYSILFKQLSYAICCQVFLTEMQKELCTSSFSPCLGPVQNELKLRHEINSSHMNEIELTKLMDNCNNIIHNKIFVEYWSVSFKSKVWNRTAVIWTDLFCPTENVDKSLQKAFVDFFLTYLFWDHSNIMSYTYRHNYIHVMWMDIILHI